MNETKLTVRVSRDLLLQAKRYASANNTTVSRLVSAYLRHLANQADPLAEAPIVKRLSGILPKEASLEDYQRHLHEKYGKDT